jgi:hypothetical protein
VTAETVTAKVSTEARSRINMDTPSPAGWPTASPTELPEPA